MALELHNEQRIGYKPLSDADLGKSKKSGQTHIGLCKKVFTYLPNEYTNNDCILLYDKSIEHLPFYFDRIQRQDGNYDSPKTRIGNEDESTIARRIREITTIQPANKKWYLVWFGLKDEQPVFILINEQSQIYKDITAAGIAFPTRASALTAQSPHFVPFLQLLETHTANINIESTEDPQASEENDASDKMSNSISEEYCRLDINETRENREKVGRIGETEINKYFEDCKARGEILNFTWVNCEKESGKPYDFILETATDGKIYLDVKTTDKRFNEQMYFSSQEVAFATAPNYENSEYHVYRVYKNDAGELCLRICVNARELLKPIHSYTLDYKSAVNTVAKIETIKFTILPAQPPLVFGEEKKLS